jgi:phage host-nuclease inhibitor protein Gam
MELAAAVREHETLAAAANQALAALNREWGVRLAPLRDQVAHLEVRLRELERQQRQSFFGTLESAKVDLPHGSLLYELTRPVIRARAVTPEKLEELGCPEAVRIAKSVDWDLLNAWPDERLWAVGTDRRKKEVFSYELPEG